MAVSVRLRPTTLTGREEAFLEGQIARCERYGQVGLGAAGEDLDRLHPTFRDRARLLQQHLEPLLASLRAHAALMVLEVASPARVPMAVADAVGSMASRPVGGRSEGFFGGSLRGLAGGHRLLPVGARDLGERTQAFGTLDVILPTDPTAPAEAPRLPSLIDPAEAAAAFRFPPAPVDDLPGIAVRRWRLRAAPAGLPGEGTLLGTTVGEDPGRPVRIGVEDRRRHAFVLGATGSGKTTLLKTMILDDMRAGAGLCVIDPHGDLFTELLARVPEHRIADVVVLDPTDVEYPVGLNLLECEGEEDRHFVAQEVVSILTRLLRDEYGDGGFGHVTGPVFFEHLRMNLLLAMSHRNDPGTLLEFYLIFQERNYWRRWLPLEVSDPLLERWVGNVLPAMDYVKWGSDGASMGAYMGSKFLSFTFDPRVRGIFGQKRSTLDLRVVMDEGKILLVNLAKGALTEGTARFLGMVVLTKLMAAAMGRLARPERDRREFRLYVDEFQSIATESFATLLSEARKFRVSSVLASQFVGQIGNPRITEAIFGNAGTLVCFRLGLDDAGRLEPRFQPAVTRSDLVHLPNWHAYMSTLLQGQPVRPFAISTVEEQRPVDEGRARQVRDASRRKYARARAAVEAELAASARGPRSEAS